MPALRLNSSGETAVHAMDKQPSAPEPTLEQDFSILSHGFFDEQLSRLQEERERIMGSEDPEGVHQMRIAIRRTRSVLSSMDLKQSKFYAEAQWLARELGVVRDLEALLSREADGTDDTGFKAYLHSRWRAQRQALKDHLMSARYEQFVLTFNAFIGAIAPANQTIRQAARHSISRQLRQTKRLGRRINAASSDALVHQLRIHCKHLRYLIEMFEPAAPGTLQRFSANAKALQDLLGDINDQRIAMVTLAQYADQIELSEENRRNLVATGKQIRDRELTARTLRAEFPGAWADFDRCCTRTRLRHVLRDEK